MFLSRTKEPKPVHIDQGNLRVSSQISVFHSSVGPIEFIDVLRSIKRIMHFAYPSLINAESYRCNKGQL